MYPDFPDTQPAPPGRDLSINSQPESITADRPKQLPKNVPIERPPGKDPLTDPPPATNDVSNIPCTHNMCHSLYETCSNTGNGQADILCQSPDSKKRKSPYDPVEMIVNSEAPLYHGSILNSNVASNQRTTKRKREITEKVQVERDSQEYWLSSIGDWADSKNCDIPSELTGIHDAMALNHISNVTKEANECHRNITNDDSS